MLFYHLGCIPFNTISPYTRYYQLHVLVQSYSLSQLPVFRLNIFNHIKDNFIRRIDTVTQNIKNIRLLYSNKTVPLFKWKVLKMKPLCIMNNEKFHQSSVLNYFDVSVISIQYFILSSLHICLPVSYFEATLHSSRF